ncbi:peptidoglycan D,D-transpeptidase FtsI family protein [Dongia sp.]|uniref:peptidoglycan D,D-transpeptidase FtsI family protein n=1 Tax=Dongia sp. TaxID=1977262 RepID=UPI0037508EC5
MKNWLRRKQRPQPGFDIRQPQPVIDPMAIEPELSGVQSRVLETSHNRLMLGAGLFGVAFLVITVRLAMVTLLPQEADAAVAHKSGVAPVADRADIIDRNGVVLATSLTTASLFANPSQIRDPDDTAERLNMVLPDLNIASTAAKLDTDKTFIWLKRNLTPKQQDGVNRLGIPGLYFQMETKRIYPQGSLTSHVVGFTDVDSRGLAGVERSFDDLLSGGQRPLQLSIDIRIQHIVHEEVSRAIADFNGIGGVGVVTDIKTGEVLSLVSLPDFDPTDPGKADADTRFNRATLGVFEMGSVFKIFNTAIALDSKTCKISDGFDASKPIKISRFTISDFHGKNRWLSVPEIFTYSSNIGSAKMADAFGAEVQQSYLAKLGLLDKSPIELPEVGMPMYPAAKNWKRINTMTVSYGHGVSVSPFQLVTAMSATINKGLLITPTILKRTANEVPDGHRVVSEKTSTAIRQLMRLVTLVGTGKLANTPGYQVGGKTGTADKEKGGRYSENANLASFLAAFPMDDPKYAILVMVDEPKGNQKSHGYATGGWVSAPAVGSIVERMAPLMGISPMPVLPPEEENPLVALVPDYDSPASKKSNSLVMQVKATGDAESKSVAAEPAAPGAPLEAE